MSCDPGWMEFAVTPSAATSRARVFRKPVTPARAVFERMSVAIGWRTETDVIASTLPQPCACIAGTASRHMAMTARQFCSIGLAVERQVGGGEGPGRRSPSVGDQDVDPAERVAGITDELRRTRFGGHVGHERDRPGDAGGGGLDLLLRPAADGDLHAFRRERRGGAAPETLRCGRDRGAPAGDTEIHAARSLARVLSLAGSR